MSTLTRGGQATTTQLAALPRVNLLPPEVAESRRLRKVQTGLAGGVALAVVVSGALALAASNQVSAAQDDLDASKAKSTQLNAEAARYADVPRVYAEVSAAEAQLSQAMGREVRWSYFLNDLSLRTPSKVWLTSMSVTETVDSSAAVVAPGTTTAYGDPGIGTVTFAGKGYQHNDVASWLRALGQQKGLANPYFSQSIKEKIDSQDSVTFTSQATITEDALSGRYTGKAGS